MRTTCRLVLVLGAVLMLGASAACSRSAQSYLDRGNAEFEKGNLDAAVLEYRNAVAKDAMFAPARVKLAEAYARQGNRAGALAEWVRAADLLPGDADAQLRAGALLLEAGRAEDARARADRALALNAKSVDALVLRANALANLRDFDTAISQMQEALRLDPGASLLGNLGVLEAVRGNTAEAEAAFRKAVAADPKSVLAQTALGYFLWSTGRLAEAESAFKAAVGSDARGERANRALAVFYLRSGRLREAEPYLKQAVEASGQAEGQLGLADYYAATGRPAEALAVLTSLASNARYWAVARSKMADVHYREGRRDEAFRTIDEVVTKHPGLAYGRLVRCRLLLAAGRLDEALRDAQEAVKLEPQGAEGHYVLGQVLEARHDLGGAATAFAEVLRLMPAASNAQVRLAMVEMQRDAMPTATQLAERAARQEPGNLTAHLVLARALLAKGDLDRAEAITRSLLQGAPGVAGVQNQAGMLALAKGDRAGARAAFEEALAIDNLMVEPLTMLVTLDLQEKQPDRARGRVEERLRKTPDSSLVLVLAGRTWAATGDGPKAQQFLRKAIDVDSSSFDAYLLLGQLYLADRKPDQAVEELDKLAARQPGSVGAATLAAMIRQSQGQADDARTRYERIVEANPHAAVASNNLAWMYATRNQQLDRALQLAQAAKAELPDHPEVNDTLAFVYLRKNLPALAVPPLRIAVEKAPGNPVFHYRLGMAYARVGDAASARRELEQALKLKADFEGAAEARELLRTIG